MADDLEVDINPAHQRLAWFSTTDAVVMVDRDDSQGVDYFGRPYSSDKVQVAYSQRVGDRCGPTEAHLSKNLLQALF